ncbi:MAG: hypothetical protein RBT41_10805 [Clostridia bacterium]|jgi:hypothetical protein|nr:hypothetical protein [Clostridia bacterium]
MKKIKDRLTLGLLCGFLGNIPKTILNEVSYRKGLEKTRYGEIVTGIFMPKKQAQSKDGVTFGVAGDYLLASMLGIPLVYLFTYTGKDNYGLKGWVGGMAGMGLFRALIANIGPGKTYPKDVLSNSMMSISSTLWGITAATLIVHWGDERLFKTIYRYRYCKDAPENPLD